ncbi:MAG: hypothetical protein WCY19_04675 [Candidatus Gastranaerophilaceae bacterium]
MIKYFSRAFKVTNENIILTTPLILFLFLLSIYLGVAQKAPVNLVSVFLLLVTILFMIGAFFAGWFFMVKKAVDLDRMEFVADEDKARASFNLIKEVPVGIGEYFLPFIGALILYSGLLALLVFVGYQLGLHFIGKLGVSLVELKMAMDSPVAMKSLVSSLSSEQLVKLNAWNFMLMGIMTFYSFITMFWGVQIVSKTKNPLIAFFQSVKFIFKNFLSAIVLFMYISIINFSVSLLNAFAMINPIVYFISMLIYFYFLVYVVVLIFLYYDRENNPKLEEKSEANCPEGDCNSGADSLGQEQPRDTES